jgi:hypothetical protein
VKPIRIVVLVLAVACAFPAGASALELEVNTLKDPGDGGCFYPEEECTLRSAIYAAEASEEPDTISFEVAGTIKPGFPLPELEGSTTLDATTAPGWEGSPVVFLDGSEAEFEGGTWGIRVRENSSANIYGLGIGEFGLGIWFEPRSSGEACGNYVGTDLSGTLPRPNFDGVWVGEETGLVQVGRMCPEAIGGNLISGNAEFGVVVAGEEVEVDQNLIGTDASGTSPLPNGPPPETVEPFGGGILVTPTATFINIGGIDDMALPHNVIAFNSGPGVLVQTGAKLTTIRENSIHSNSGLGIDLESGSVTPQISSIATVVKGTTTVAGTVTGAPNTEYILEFFASEECDPSGFGEGQFFTASTDDEVKTDGSGTAEFSSTLLGLVLPKAHFFTLTATDDSRTSTSEFSNCVSADFAPEEGGKQITPPPPPPPPTPVNGKTVTVAPKSGRVLIKVPGSNKFVPLGVLQSIPVGSIVDATNGRVTLTSIDENGIEQSADFYEGRFQVFQAAGGALVTLRLRGGDFSSCPKAGSSARASKRSGRKLWGSGSGRFRTQGNFGSASVRGTIWLTVDQCKGTLFKVRRGVVTVSDFVADKTLSLPAGQSYWAKKLPG